MGKTRPKDIGTAAETAVKKVLQRYWPAADRSPLRGANDAGDIDGTGDFIWEVKGGAAAKTASEGQVQYWVDEAKREARHAKVPFGILVTQRGGYGSPRADQWWVHVDMSTLNRLMGGDYISADIVRIKLLDFLIMLGAMGWIQDTDAS